MKRIAARKAVYPPFLGVEPSVTCARTYDARVSYTCSNTREHFSEKIVRV
jgi:hypothetical protein